MKPLGFSAWRRIGGQSKTRRVRLIENGRPHHTTVMCVKHSKNAETQIVDGNLEAGKKEGLRTRGTGTPLDKYENVSHTRKTVFANIANKAVIRHVNAA